MSSSAAVETDADAPDLVCELDSIRGIVDALSSVRWKRLQDALVELSEHGIVIIVEETGCLQAKVYLQRELFIKYDYGAHGRPRFGVSLGLFIDCLNTFSVPGRSNILQLRYPGPDMQLMLRSVDSPDACIYAEIRTRIPETISWDYNFEPVGSTPLSFTVKLLAVESIYGDDIVILENQSGLKCFQAHIHVEVPKGLCVTAKFNSSTSHQNKDIDSSDFSYSFEVEYLQPILLTCLLPKSYPSNCPPHFTISVKWLTSAKISDLCCKLDSILQEQAGQEVIYQWLEWLHGCSLSYLGFDNEIVLGPYSVKNDGDRRAISGSVSPDIDVPSIKSYNDEERLENFCNNIQECSICLSEFAGSELIRLPCQHFFCRKCLKTFSDMHIMEGTVLKLQCPEVKCGGMIPPGLLKRLLGEEEFEH